MSVKTNLKLNWKGDDGMRAMEMDPWCGNPFLSWASHLCKRII